MTLPFSLADWSSMASMLGVPPLALPPINQSFIASNTTAPVAGRDATMVRSLVPSDYDPTPVSVAQAQMAARGITDFQRDRARGNHPRLGEAAYLDVTPWGYEGHSGELLKTLIDALSNKPLDTSSRPAARSTPLDVAKTFGGTPPNRDDAWRLYLGLPQKDSTFGVSTYQPSHATIQKPYFKLNGFEQSYNFNTPERLRQAVEIARTAQAQGKQSVPAYDATGVMGHYQLSHGTDPQGRPYLAYYDRWDLDTPGGGMAGHPYEIYDRVYYDPKTFKVVTPPAQQSPEADLQSRETTKLSAKDESAFRAWAEKNGITDVNDPEAHYDYRGFWKAHGNVPVRFGVDHFPDTYKQHGHPTFSDESQYALGAGEAGHWVGNTYLPPKKKLSAADVLALLQSRSQ